MFSPELTDSLDPAPIPRKPRRTLIACTAFAALAYALATLGCSQLHDETAGLDLAPYASKARMGQDNGSLVTQWPESAAAIRRHAHARLIVDASTPQRHASHHSF